MNDKNNLKYKNGYIESLSKTCLQFPNMAHLYSVFVDSPKTVQSRTVLEMESRSTVILDYPPPPPHTHTHVNPKRYVY